MKSFQIESSKELKEFKEELRKRLQGLLHFMKVDIDKQYSLEEVIYSLKQEIINLKSLNHILLQERQNLFKIHKINQDKIKDLEQSILDLRISNGELCFQVTITQEKMNDLENNLRIKFEKPLTLITNEYKKFSDEITIRDKQMNKVILLNTEG